MYFVDRDKIEQTLVFLEKQIHLFNGKVEWNSSIEQAALERLAHTMLEAVLDVGNAVIDGFIMRDPGSYEDIVDILVDEKVVSKDMGQSLKTLVHYRKTLVQSYIEINHLELEKVFKTHMGHLSKFSDAVRHYLVSELGPVTAFKN